jgi:hypothetical protein
MSGKIDIKDKNNWIAREGSGHQFVEYVIILCCVSIVSAVIFGAIGAELDSIYRGFAFIFP